MELTAPSGRCRTIYKINVLIFLFKQKILVKIGMRLSNFLIFVLGAVFCFPNALARNRRQSMQQVHESLTNELENEISLFHFPRLQPEFKRQLDKKSVYNRQQQGFNTAAYEPILKNKIPKTNDFFNLYQQMYLREW